jgi:hypothetical protein
MAQYLNVGDKVIACYRVSKDDYRSPAVLTVKKATATRVELSNGVKLRNCAMISGGTKYETLPMVVLGVSTVSYWLAASQAYEGVYYYEYTKELAARFGL